MIRSWFALCFGLIAWACMSLVAQAADREPLSVDDLADFREVADPQLSPDGEWVAYTVETMDFAADEKRSAVWMVSWDGSQRLQLTGNADSASTPRWSPDGRFLSFLTARSHHSERSCAGTNTGEQVWLLDRRGGAARQLTHFEGEISDYAWSPDSKRLALVARSEKPPEVNLEERTRQPTPPEPIVIDRYFFKHDEHGYLGAAQRSRIHLYEIESKTLAALTTEQTYDESDPAWSPDGSMIAFVSNRDGEEWDRTENTDVYLAQARPGSAARKLTLFEGSDSGPLAWSPDGREIAYVQGSEPRYSIYGVRPLAVVALEGAPRLAAKSLDRDTFQPRFSRDGRSIDFLVEDDRHMYLARVARASGAITKLTQADRVVSAHSQAAGRIAVLATTDDTPPEIHALQGASLCKLTSHNDSWLQRVHLGTTQEIGFRSPDGTEVHGLITRPPLHDSRRKYPTLLWIHGGPYGQDDHKFEFERQLFAASGYIVIQANYRGSAGRGAEYGRSIFADWGNKEVMDVLAAVDYAVEQGIADPERLGIGGWSYGGFLTDYVIASDTRFKAAISGAGAGSQLPLYGSDQYVFAYDQEFEPPWRNPERWMKLSYPFFRADRIRTPTLFLGGERDFNVPIIGSEQMYQALKTLKVPTQLVIYPGEKHSLVRPSFVRDSLQRYLDWFGRYLQPRRR